MGTFSVWHWVIVAVVVLVLFGGGGKISRMMGDFGKGLKAFKKNVKEETDDTQGGDDAKQLSSESSANDASGSESKDKAAKS